MNHSNEKCAVFATNKNTKMVKKKQKKNPVDFPTREQHSSEKTFLMNFRQNEPAYIKKCISCNREHNCFRSVLRFPEKLAKCLIQANYTTIRTRLREVEHLSNRKTASDGRQIFLFEDTTRVVSFYTFI